MNKRYVIYSTNFLDEPWVWESIHYDMSSVDDHLENYLEKDKYYKVETVYLVER